MTVRKGMRRIIQFMEHSHLQDLTNGESVSGRFGEIRQHTVTFTQFIVYFQYSLQYLKAMVDS
jgi:hypothetical protein